jgi:hypothetical protein
MSLHGLRLPAPNRRANGRSTASGYPTNRRPLVGDEEVELERSTLDGITGVNRLTMGNARFGLYSPLARVAFAYS